MIKQVKDNMPYRELDAGVWDELKELRDENERLKQFIEDKGIKLE